VRLRRRRHRPLHLLEVGVRWPPETFLCWKLEGLAARGVRVTVASRSIFDPDARLRGVELVELPQRAEPELRPVRRQVLALLVAAPLRLARLLWDIRQLPPAYRRRYGGAAGLLAMYLPLARLRPDVVHFEWNTAATVYLPMFDVWGCPVVTSCHGSDLSTYPHVPGQELYAVRLREVMSRARAVHCVAESTKRDAMDFGLDPAKACVIRQGVDPDVFRPANGKVLDARALRVTAIGWLRWMKGYEYALAAIRTAVDRGVPVQFEILGGDPTEEIGERSERERILHTVADLDLEGRVRVRGKLSSAEVARELQASDVLLHASLDEGLPTVLLEAMACGLPVVATDCGGVSEAFTDGVDGFLVAPRDPEALAEALLRLWEDPGLRVRMGQAGRATVQSRFTLERQLREFLAMYQEVVGA
jgi:colanic acid/amylovoran biosynthesis glycosyltransferase